MKVSVRQFLIAALVAFYLGCETSAAAIGGEEVGEQVQIGKQVEIGEQVQIGKQVEIGEQVDVGEDATPEAVAETAVADEGTVYFKCGNLNCPNGVFCEIIEIPSDDEKTITKTTRCRDADGNVLDEETTTENVPEGEIPFSTIRRKIVKNGKNGNFFGSSSYAGSYRHGNVASILGEKDKENAIDFDFDSIGFGFGEILSTERKILKSTSDLMDKMFKKFWW